MYAILHFPHRCKLQFAPSVYDDIRSQAVEKRHFHYHEVHDLFEEQSQNSLHIQPTTSKTPPSMPVFTAKMPHKPLDPYNDIDFTLTQSQTTPLNRCLTNTGMQV
jgi:hypothetical protein